MMRPLSTLFFVSLTLAPLASGFRMVANKNQTEVDCGKLSSMRVRDHDIGLVAVLICNIWPTEKFGKFPISNVQQAVVLLEEAFGVGGIFDMLGDIATGRGKGGAFCWRSEKMREPLEPLGFSCPANLNATEHVDELMPREAQALRARRSSKRVAAEGETDTWTCRSSLLLPDDMCMCTSTGGNTTTVPMHALPNGCDMVHWDKCYGECPWGYQPSFVTGSFRPVCTSICADSTHPYSCGFGCANTMGNCARATGDQVGEVVRIVGHAMAFAFANPAIHTTVDAVVGVAEFSLTVLTKLVQAGRATWGKMQRLEGEATILIALVQFIIETGKGLYDDIMQLQAVFSSAVQLVLELMDADWTLIGNFHYVGEKILEHGSQILLTLYQLIKAFVWPLCEEADESVKFTVEDAGDTRLHGPWMERGSHSGKPRYTKIGDKNTILEWSRGRLAWRTMVDDTWFGVGRATLYQSSEQTPEVPMKGWEAHEAPEPVPTFHVLQ